MQLDAVLEGLHRRVSEAQWRVILLAELGCLVAGGIGIRGGGHVWRSACGAAAACKLWLVVCATCE